MYYVLGRVKDHQAPAVSRLFTRLERLRQSLAQWWLRLVSFQNRNACTYYVFAATVLPRKIPAGSDLLFEKLAGLCPEFRGLTS